MAICGVCGVKLTMADDIAHKSDNSACIYSKKEIVGYGDAVTGHVHRACKERKMTYYVKYNGDTEEFSNKVDAEDYIREQVENDEAGEDDFEVIEGTERTVSVERTAEVRIS